MHHYQQKKSCSFCSFNFLLEEAREDLERLAASPSAVERATKSDAYTFVVKGYSVRLAHSLRPLALFGSLAHTRTKHICVKGWYIKVKST